MRVGPVLLVGEVDLLSIESDNELGSWPLIGAIANQLLHILEILSGDMLRSRQIGSN